MTKKTWDWKIDEKTEMFHPYENSKKQTPTEFLNVKKTE